jgi:hypothetical protein
LANAPEAFAAAGAEGPAMADCCDALKFVPLEDLGHAESVDWDLGRCASCNAYLLQKWSEYAADRLYYDTLTDDEAERFRRSEGRERISLLKAWYSDH